MEISLDRSVAALEALAAFERREIGEFSDDELAAAFEAAAHHERLAQVPSAMLAAEIARRDRASRHGGIARKRGHRGAHQMVATGSGGTGRQARDLITAGGLFGGGGEAGGDAGAGGEAGGGGEAGSGGEAGAGESGGGEAGGAGGDGSRGRAHAVPPKYPHVAAAFADGRLSAAKATLLRDTLDQLDGQVAAVTAMEVKLVEKAVTLSLADLEKVCLDVIARWNQGEWEKREQRLRNDRFLVIRETKDGAVTVAGKFDPAAGAVLLAYFDAQVKEGFRARRDAGLGKAEAGEAGRLRADALTSLARHGMRCEDPGSGVSTTVVVRLSDRALRTGVGIASCDNVSVPLSAGQVRRMAVDAQILPVVLGSGSQVLDVGYARRFFTPTQRLALAERDGGCAFCHAPVAWCDAHHVAWWTSDHGPTDLSNGVLLCVSCHHRIHDDGWQVRTTDTQVWFIPPRRLDPEQTPRLGGKAALHVPT